MSASGGPASADDVAPVLPVDSLGMWDATVAFPDQVAAAVTAAETGVPRDWSDRSTVVSNVAVLGMGGSGIAGDVLAAVAAPEMAVPVTVVKGYDLPAFVGPDTLVFAISFSGDTEETLAAAGAAVTAGAQVVTISGGGALAEIGAARGGAHVALPTAIPQPRAALGAMAVPPLVLLERAGLMNGVTERLAAVVDVLARRRDQLAVHGGPAAETARRIGRTFPLVHGSTGPAAVAAQRWKTQLNENAKIPAFWSSQPELCHNEIAGWGQGGDITRQTMTLVTLRHATEHPQIARRFSLVEEIMREVVADVIEIVSPETDSISQFFDLAYIGDFVSLFAAGREATDPGPVPILTDVKDQLHQN
jgi:glucose/mannose-6-phosphate isomerase